MDKSYLSDAVLNLLALHGLRAAPGSGPDQPFDILLGKPCKSEVLFVGYPQWSLEYWVSVVVTLRKIL